MSDRYAGKPFLELVDAYVIDATGHLDPAADRSLALREPEFRRLFGESGGWRAIVEQRMKFPAGMAGAIREVWEAGRVKFVAANGSEPDPDEFARHFVDSKFPH